MQVPTRRKVFAIITRQTSSGQDVLLLYHPDHPEAGIQVPAGTMEPGEGVVPAAFREAEEETGLTNLRLERILGETTVDMRPFGKHEFHHRTFVHLTCNECTPERWFHWEEHPDDQPGERIRFQLVWTALDEHLPPLIGGHDAFLGMLG